MNTRERMVWVYQPIAAIIMMVVCVYVARSLDANCRSEGMILLFGGIIMGLQLAQLLDYFGKRLENRPEPTMKQKAIFIVAIVAVASLVLWSLKR